MTAMTELEQGFDFAAHEETAVAEYRERQWFYQRQATAIEITPDALKAFLDKRLGADGRMSEWSYDWTARLLKMLRFRTLEQVEKCIRDFDDDRLSRIAAGSRVGQTTRFEYMLLAGMGALHPPTPVGANVLA